MRILSSRPVVKSVGIAVAILVVIACAPGQAKAECGDYVHIIKDAPAEAGKTVPLQKAPCNGPNCSGKPATPPAPLTAPVTESEVSEPFADASRNGDDSNHAREMLSRDLAVILPSTIPSSIFHPPRAA